MVGYESSRLRVCFVSLSAYGYFDEEAPAGGGAQRQLHLLSTSLTGEFDVHFVVGEYGQPRTVRREGVTLHSAYTPDRTASIARRGRQLALLFRALQRADADVYVARCHPRKLTVLYALTSLLRRPLIYHVATDAFVDDPPTGVQGFSKRVYERAIRRCQVVAQTPHQARVLYETRGVPARVVPNGYPPADAIDIYDVREHFLWVGRLDETEKRPHLFLDLAERLPNEQFVLIGPPEEDDAYGKQVVRRATDAENVEYIGRVSPSEVHDFYRRAIALVNTSVSGREGFPNTFLEAWRYATPVVSLDVDPGRFLHPETEGGVETAYAGGDFESLASLVQRAADDLAYRRELGSTGMRAFQRHYQLPIVVGSYRELLTEVVSGG